jgi:hypothetical protein
MTTAVVTIGAPNPKRSTCTTAKTLATDAQARPYTGLMGATFEFRIRESP